MQSVNVNLYHEGNLISSQPWIEDEEGHLLPSVKLFCFDPYFNEAINEDNEELWSELQAYVIVCVNDCSVFKKTKTDAAIASISEEVGISIVIEYQD